MKEMNERQFRNYSSKSFLASSLLPRNYLLRCSCKIVPNSSFLNLILLKGLYMYNLYLG